jgi:predicted O-linked N-acetylglucosamine transferase (SPINDLY family)
VIELWARILNAVPDSRLLMRDSRLSSSGMRSAVRQRFAEHGIAPERLQLHGRVKDDAEHLQGYNEIDILLDPFPYNGVTTTCEALWMGIPVIALEGQRSGARSGVAILRHAGVPELVAPDRDAYVRIAAALAGDVDRLTALHRELRPRMLASPLCDAPRLAREIEHGYRRAWQDWCEG